MIRVPEKLAEWARRGEISSLQADSEATSGRAWSAGRIATLFKFGFHSPPASVPMGRRVYAIGDVHGRLDLLDQLLAQIEEDMRELQPAKVSVVLLGDMIDRGPNSKGVLHRAMAGLEWATLYCVLGNHERMLLAVLDGNEAVAVPWFQFGGRETLASWGVDLARLSEPAPAGIVEAARDALSALDCSYLRHLAYRLRCGDYMFVHAGIRPGIRLDRQRPDDLLWIREPFLESRRYHGAVIVHGHSISQDIEERPNRIGIDTGAYRTGRLTALVLEGSSRRILCAEVATNGGVASQEVQRENATILTAI